MASIDKIAQALFGSKRAESAEVLTDATTRTYVGVALSDSEDGTVLVDLGGDVTLPDDIDDLGIEYNAEGIYVATGPSVSKGDEVVVTIYGGGSLKTPIVTGVTGEGDAQNVRIGSIEADYVKATELEADVAKIGFLTAGSATITDLQAVDVTITGRLSAAELDIDNLEADHVSVSDFEAEQAKIVSLQAAAAYIDSLTADNIKADDIKADHATIGSLDTNYAQIDLANVDNAWIENGLIRDAAISNEMVNSISANKLTAGTINGSVINVTNLNADNITAGTINGQRIGEGSLSLSKLEDDVYTEAEVDSKLSTMQAEIDGAIETWTGTDVPTLNNSPASDWTTTDERDRHVGDVYFVVNSQSQQNGYNYRFTKSGSTYSWQLIKDTDITNALQRLTTAEGQITQFDSDISTLKTDTGELKTKTQSLETSLGDKVDVTTFNELSSDVEENSASITTLSNTVSQKADSSTVTTLSNTVNAVQQTASTNSSNISSLQTITTNNGLTTSTNITNRVSSVEQNLDGITTRVSATEASIETVSNPNLSPYLSHTFGDTDYWRDASKPNKSTELGDIGTYLSDGWMHVDMDNSARTGMAYINCFWVNADSNITESTEYTFLVEIRNLVFAAGTTIHVRPTSSNTGTARKGQFGTTHTIDVSESRSIYQVTTTRSDFTGCVTISDGYVYVDAGTNASFDIRISLYEGKYSGPYKPYVDQTLESRVTTAESSITQNAQNIELKVSKDGVISSINQSAESVKIDASKVEIDGTAIFTAINSDVDSAITSKGYATTTQAQGYATTAKSEAISAAATVANSREQLIYRSAASGTSSMSGTTTWVTDVTGAQATWTAKRPEYSQSYPVLFVATQRQTVDGTVTCTTPIIDATTTVIDGGNIITGTVTANKLNASDINASNSLTIGALSTDTQDDILNSNVVVGGRNLLLQSGYAATVTRSGITFTNNGDGSITASGTATATTTVNFATSLTLDEGTYTLSGCPSGGGVSTYRLDILTVPVSSGTATVADNGDSVTFETTGGTTGAVRFRIQSGATVDVTMYPKLERGDKATDWTPAPEDVDDAIMAVDEEATSGIESLSSDLSTLEDSVSESLGELRTELSKEIDARSEWLTFESGTGLTIGSSKSDFNTVVTSDSMEFRDGSDVLATASGDGFDAPVMSAEEVHVGSWMWVTRNNGNLALKWVG